MNLNDFLTEAKQKFFLNENFLDFFKENIRPMNGVLSLCHYGNRNQIQGS